MKKEDLFEAIGDIDDKFLIESQKYTRKRKPKIRWICGMAAAVLLFFLVGQNVLWKENNSSPVQKEPVLAKVAPFEVRSEGGMYEIMQEDYPKEISYYDNLLKQKVKKTYPVYKGYGSYDDILMGKAGKEISEVKMDRLANQLAKKGNTEIRKTKKEMDHKKINSKTYFCLNKMIIQVFRTGDINIQMPDSKKQPEVSKQSDIYKRSILFYKYYYEKYNYLFDFKKEQYKFKGGWDPDINSNTKIMQMEINDATIANDAGYYYGVSIVPGNKTIGDAISFYLYDYGKKLGNYPIITQKEATKELLKGNAKTIEPLFSNITKERISYVTLDYMGDMPQPVYTFYLKLTEKEKKVAYEDAEEIPKKNVYIKYYVSAVKQKYLNN